MRVFPVAASRKLISVVGLNGLGELPRMQVSDRADVSGDQNRRRNNPFSHRLVPPAPILEFWAAFLAHVICFTTYRRKSSRF